MRRAALLLVSALGLIATSLTASGYAAADTTPTTACSSAPFRDVPVTSPFCEDVSWLVNHEITSGFADHRFDPTAPVSRQAMAAFLYRATMSRPTAPSCTHAPFPDVPVASTFCGAIAWASDNGLAHGYGDKGFHPTAPMTRRAMAAVLYPLAETATTAPTCTDDPFTDVSTADPFCGAIAWLAGTGIATGFADGGFHPSAVVSRQAMAAFLHRYIYSAVGPATGSITGKVETGMRAPDGALTVALLENAVVYATVPGSGHFYSATSDASGTYSITGLPASDSGYAVCAVGLQATGGPSSAGYENGCYGTGQTWNGLTDSASFPAEGTMPVQTGPNVISREINVILSSASGFAGKITDADTGAGIPGVTVQVFYPYTSGPINRLMGPRQTSTADGSYELRGLPFGQFILCFDTTGTGYAGQCYNGIPYNNSGRPPLWNAGYTLATPPISGSKTIDVQLTRS